MKRTITTVFVIVLLLSLAAPTAAVAKRGGVPASERGRGHAQGALTAPDGEAEASVGMAEPSGPGRGLGKGGAKRAEVLAEEADGSSDDAVTDDEGAADGTASEDEATGDDEMAPDDADTEAGDEGDGSGPVEPGLRGIRNALSRLEANLQRMQADFEAGTRKGLPPGLQRVIAKFMAWLGISPDDGEGTGTGDEAAGDDSATGGQDDAVAPEDPGSEDDAVSDDPGTDDDAAGEDIGTGGEDPGAQEPGAGDDDTVEQDASESGQAAVPLALMSLLMR